MNLFTKIFKNTFCLIKKMEDNIKHFKNLDLSNTGYHNLRIEDEQLKIEPRKVIIRYIKFY